MQIPVTVVIPNYNHAKYLPQRIESVLNQTFADFELIILDDCSPDNSKEIIEYYAAQDARIRVVYNEENSGSTFKQWNKGFGLARGKYIWIAESDDYAEPLLLVTLVSKMEQDENIGLAYCNSMFVDENGIPKSGDGFENFYSSLDEQRWAQDFVIEGRTLITTYMSYRNIIPNASAVLIRKTTLDKVGKANETFRLNGDWIFWAALIADSKVAFVADKLNYFRFHTNNARSKTLTKGIALQEMTVVAVEMKQYGTPHPEFLARMIRTINSMWFEGIIANAIPLRTNKKIFQNMRLIDSNFNARFFHEVKKNLLAHKMWGLRRLVIDGIILKALKK